MTEREKIANILNSTEISQELSKDDIYKFADALIKNGYGNVAELKRRAEAAEKERDEYRRSNRIVLRGLEIIKRNIMRYCHTDLSNILLQAAREIEEEERK